MCGGGLLTSLRDTTESALGASMNLIVPGAESLMSKGSQEQMGSGIGGAINVGTDVAGAAGILAGGGALLGGLAGGGAGAVGTGGAGFLPAGAGGAMTGAEADAALAAFDATGATSTGTLGGLAGGGLGSGLGALSGGMSLAQGALGLYESQQAKAQAKSAAAAADPFAGQRAQYGLMLQQLMQDPSTLTKTPGYQAGIQAVERSMASQGYGGSGNMAAALQQYGGNAFQQQVATLANLAGAQFNPAAAQQIGQSGMQYAQGLTGQSLGTLAQGGMSLYNALK